MLQKPNLPYFLNPGTMTKLVNSKVQRFQQFSFLCVLSFFKKRETIQGGILIKKIRQIHFSALSRLSRKRDFFTSQSVPSNYFQMLLKKVNSTYLYIHENEDDCIHQTTHFCQKHSHCHSHWGDLNSHQTQKADQSVAHPSDQKRCNHEHHHKCDFSFTFVYHFQILIHIGFDLSSMVLELKKNWKKSKMIELKRVKTN